MIKNPLNQSELLFELTKFVVCIEDLLTVRLSNFVIRLTLSCKWSRFFDVELNPENVQHIKIVQMDVSNVI